VNSKKEAPSETVKGSSKKTVNRQLTANTPSKVKILSQSWSLAGKDYVEEDFMDAFRVFDTDGDGRITAKELMAVLVELGIKTSKSDVKKMIQELDYDRNGTIEYSEFVQMMTMPAYKYDDEFELREAFKCIDLG
jgi:Ca2+-binding EF-hand superfamily protein